MSGRVRRPMVLGTVGVLTLLCRLASADVVTESTMSVDGVGAMAFGNMTGTTRVTVSGERSRTDNDIQMKSRLVRVLAHSTLGPTAQIVRLDQDRVWHLNLNKKEYSETTFEQMRAQLDKMSDQMNEAQEKQQQPAALDDSKCDWLPPRVELNRSGEKQQIAGYDAERATIVAAQPCKDKSSGAVCELALVLDEWMSQSFTESAELLKFQKAYAAKLALDISNGQTLAQRAQSTFGRYKGVWSEIVSKMKDVKGYPVRSSFVLAIGGAQCRDAKQAESENQAGSSGGGAATTPGALAGQVAGKLGSLFHKKKDDADSGTAAAGAPAGTAPGSSPPAAALPPGDFAMLTMTSQLVSVSNSAAPADAFDIPAGFTRRELKNQ